MKRLIGITLIGLMILASGPAAFAQGRRRPGPTNYYHHRSPHGRHAYYHRGWTGRDTFGAVGAGILGAGLIIAAAGNWGRPVYYTPSYYCPPPPPPPPVYYAPVYCVPATGKEKVPGIEYCHFPGAG